MRVDQCSLALALFALSCSSDDATVKERYDYRDSAGRACRATLEKTSPGSPSLHQSVTCDGEPRECSAESSACFVLTIDDMTEDIRSCPACCRGNSSSFVRGDCAVVACESDSECIYAEAKCVEGTCRCPGGFCE